MAYMRCSPPQAHGGKGRGKAPALGPFNGTGKGKGKHLPKACEAVHAACQFDDEAELQVLLEQGAQPADLNAYMWRGRSPLHTAAVNGALRALRILLQRGPSEVDALNSFQETPLHLAAGAGCLDVASELLAHRAALELVDAWGRTPVGVARENGSSAVVTALLAAGACEAAVKPRSPPEPTFEQRAQKHELAAEFMQRLHVGGGAGAAFKEPVVKQMFAEGPADQAGVGARPEPNRDAARMCPAPLRALSKLVEYPGDPSVVSTLLADPSVDPCGRDMFGLTALHKFSAWDKVDLLELLLPHISVEDLNAVGGDDGFSALHHAASMGAVHTLAVLLRDPRVSRDVIDKQGRTPLAVASGTLGLAHVAHLLT